MRPFSVAALARDPDRLYRLLAGLFFLALVLVYYLPTLNLLPRGLHEWAQADRLALAISFYDHGLHFFRPQTLNIDSIDGVVGVEFPIMAYLAALGAKVLGRGAVAPLYRLLTIATAWLAYYYLFRLVFERTRQFAAALVPGVFLAASPVFAYYAGTFLPDPASAAFVLVATYYLLRYHAGRHFPDLVLALALLTLATLTKLSAGIYLVAAVGLALLWGYLQPAALTLRQRLLLLLQIGLSLAVIVGYTYYTRYLNATYHSWVFLAALKPITSAEQYDHLVARIKEVWLGEYWSPLQYRVLLASALLCVLSVGRVVRAEWLWASLIAVAAVGGVVFFWAMGPQFEIHDYYVLAPYWPALALLVALGTTLLAQRLARMPRWLPQVLFGALLLGLLVPGLRHYRARTSDPYPPFSEYYTYRWMQGGAATLTAAQVPTSATVLVLGEKAPNLSLVYFDRRGITWDPNLTELPQGAILQRMRDVGLDYLIMRQQVLQSVRQLHPDLLGAFQPLVANSQYVVLKRLNVARHW
jgi:4-amino-4-deoxy-L-arabinose transferase-like glycosyltransferase